MNAIVFDEGNSESFNVANITNIHKMGSVLDCGQFHGISLSHMSHGYKLFLKIIKVENGQLVRDG